MHGRARRPAPQPLKHVIHLVGRALHQGFDRAVQQVLHPARYTQHVGAPHSGVAIPHALHRAADGHEDGFDRGVGFRVVHGFFLRMMRRQWDE
ncbi:hypothetical protein D3C71_1836200 [compost metagenome]